MTAGVLAAKANGQCVRCRVQLPPDAGSVLCEAHRVDLAGRVRKSTTPRRAERRMRGLCAACARPSGTYYCEGGCGRRQQELRL